MASHHLVEDTFNAESEGPDIQAQDLCPSISLPTFLTAASGGPIAAAELCIRPRCAHSCAGQSKKTGAGVTNGAYARIAQKNLASRRGFRSFDTREGADYGNLGPATGP